MNIVDYTKYLNNINDVVGGFNDFFVNVEPKLAEKIRDKHLKEGETTENYTQFISIL